MHLKVLFYFSKKNCPTFKMGQTDPDDLQKQSFRCTQVITLAKTSN